jgi:hypothetical protein
MIHLTCASLLVLTSQILIGPRYGPTAYNYVALIQNQRLSGRDVALGLIEYHARRTSAERGHAHGFLAGSVADFRQRTK